jgi:hypothetical protein
VTQDARASHRLCVLLGSRDRRRDDELVSQGNASANHRNRQEKTSHP